VKLVRSVLPVLPSVKNARQTRSPTSKPTAVHRAIMRRNMQVIVISSLSLPCAVSL